MLDFLWHLRGSIPLDRTATNRETLDRLERLLERQQKPIAQRSVSDVTFDAPLWHIFFWRDDDWRPMGIYDQGRLWIDQDLGGRTLRYDLRSLHTFMFCLFGTAIILTVAWPGVALIYRLPFAALGFAWLYGMNILFALTRIPGSIRKAVRDA